MPIINIQDQLFQQIKRILPVDTGIAEAVSAVLNVSTDSAYRRIRGETPLVIEELGELCRHFNISIDHLIHHSGETVIFENRHVNNKDYTYSQYLEELLHTVSTFEKYDRKEVIYMSKDLPIFYNFYFKPLAAFRYYFWMKIQLMHEDFDKKLFDINMIPPAIEKMSTDLVRLWSMIPSTEMWNIESINSTISQIEFSRTAGHFKDHNDLMKIYEAVESTILHVQEQAEHATKYMPGEDPSVLPQNLKFFFNRVVLGDNTLLAITEENKTAFINYGQLNYLVTSDKNFCDSLCQDFENLKRRSTLISMSSERQRNIFFNILLSKVRERKQYAGVNQ